MRRARVLLLMLLAAIALALGACGEDEEAEPATTTAADEGGVECSDVEPPPTKDASFKRPGRVLERGEPAIAVVRTSCGVFEIELDTQRAPVTANSFAFLAERDFYADTVYHRIAPGFVIQGGDPLGTDPDLAGSGGPGYSVTERPPGAAEYTKGTVAMAKSSAEPPGTSGSQFFVVTAPADAGLPPDYAVLGKVSSGIEVVEAIGQLGDSTEQPTQTVVIEDVSIERG